VSNKPRAVVLAVAALVLLALAVTAAHQFWNPAPPIAVSGKPVPDPRLTAYHARCIDRVTAHYSEMVAPLVKYAPGAGTTRVTVHILADGSIPRITVSQSSGDLALDEAVVKMIRRVGRFDPLPPELGLKNVDFTLAFGFQPGKDGG
jgi:TonB family protein